MTWKDKVVDDKSFIWLSIPSLFYLFSFIFFPFLYFLLILCRNDYKVYFFYFLFSFSFIFLFNYYLFGFLFLGMFKTLPGGYI